MFVWVKGSNLLLLICKNYFVQFCPKESEILCTEVCSLLMKGVRITLIWTLSGLVAGFMTFSIFEKNKYQSIWLPIKKKKKSLWLNKISFSSGGTKKSSAVELDLSHLFKLPVILQPWIMMDLYGLGNSMWWHTCSICSDVKRKQVIP